MINLPDTTGMNDTEVAQIIFSRLEINTENKSLYELIDEVDNRLKLNLKQFLETYGKDANIELFALDQETLLMKVLLIHLTQIHRWSNI
ncbi:hypothetical protein [Hwangdonia sp.]|uniref:hypothetical protein n=1 Tax=Hwangdonia sp. TaxID=1883432 RepID=UPI003AB8D137